MCGACSHHPHTAAGRLTALPGPTMAVMMAAWLCGAGAVVFHRGYSAWKWALFAFPAFSLLALMWFCSFACFASCFKRKAPAAAATLLLWMGA